LGLEALLSQEALLFRNKLHQSLLGWWFSYSFQVA